MKRIVGWAFFLCVASASTTSARIEGIPYLDNETIGMYRSIAYAVEGDPEYFDEYYWNVEFLTQLDFGAMTPMRYVIAFSAYSVVQTANYTPAWRAPYRETFDGYIQRMLNPIAWEDWLETWDGENPLGPDNIMYSGHLLYMLTLYKQIFNRSDYESPFTLTYKDGRTFQTDVRTLAEDIAQQAEEGLDYEERHHFSVACEPGRIFVPCQTPHRVGQRIYDRIYGTDYAETNETWVGWVRDHMVDQPSGVLYDLFYPFGDDSKYETSQPSTIHPRLSGVYNAWSIWFMKAIDPQWADALYADFKNHFVVSGGESVFPNAGTAIRDQEGLEGLNKIALDNMATGFGMIAVRSFGDEALYGQLIESWDSMFGAPGWDDSGVQFLYSAPGFPYLYQNGFVLLARTSDLEFNIATNADKPWDEGFFQLPYLEEISDRNAFINQAFYDEESRALAITLNGGRAVTDSILLTVSNLSPDVEYDILRNGELYADWSREDTRLLIATPNLTDREESYIIEERVESNGGGGGCACKTTQQPTGWAGTVGLLLLGVTALRRRRRRGDRPTAP